MSFFVEIISPEGKVFGGEVKKISVPAVTGTLTILTHHIPLFTPLQAGKIKVTNLSDKIQFFALGKGLMEVKKDKVSLLIESPEYVESQLAKKESQAKQEVEKIKKEKPKKELLTPKQAVRRSLIDMKKIKRKKKIQFPIEDQT